jgi:hypothetical protein
LQIEEAPEFFERFAVVVTAFAFIAITFAVIAAIASTSAASFVVASSVATAIAITFASTSTVDRQHHLRHLVARFLVIQLCKEEQQ